MPTFERAFLPHAVRAAAFALLWTLLWTFFLLGVVRPGAQLHAHGARGVAAPTLPAAVASAAAAEGVAP